jgi:mono/diheme cytochrome c family protein
MNTRMRLALLAILFVTATRHAAAEEKVSFPDQIAPILQRRCLSCHNSSDRKGSLSLETAESWTTGGESGEPVVPGEPEESYLLELITPVQGRAAMPKDADPLRAEEIALVRAWIAQGAEWPAGLKLEPARVASTDWWSLRVLERPAVPQLAAADRQWARSPIDAFMAAKWREKGLEHAPEADRRTLIRRLYFDLIGLPPSPEEVEAFEADTGELAYERLVERLLESPHYGERWARHWLDVVHYGETHGYDKDQPRRNSWPYRDYVIRSLNSDKPYERFLREQIAGDVLYPGTRDGIEALGFIAAGPWDLIGHAEVPETKIDGKVARHLDRDDMVTNTMQTFSSLTVQCAQCHNHKFDPILQEDYYRLQAVFAAVDRTEKRYDFDPQVAQQRQQLLDSQTKLKRERETITAAIAHRAGPQLQKYDARIAELAAAGKAGSHPPEFGYHSGISATPDGAKWVQIDLQRSVELTQVVLRPCHDDFNNIGDGFGFPVRYKVELCDNAEFTAGVIVLADRTGVDVPNPKLVPIKIPVDAQRGRYLRVTATQLAPRSNDYIFSLAELEAYDAENRNLARGAEVTSLDSIEAPIRWQRRNLTDGLYAGAGSQGGAELAEQQQAREALLAAATTPADRAELNRLEAAEKAALDALAALPPQQVCYVGAVHHGSGAFAGTGTAGGKPRPIFVLNRGSVTAPGKEVAPGALSLLRGPAETFQLPPDHSEGDRRAALARWLSDKQNPLTWRSIVNRVWQYHLGRGIVDTPNDFGRNGQEPTHPELLDWLAVEFRDGGQSLKSLHRLIVTSSTYRQATQMQSAEVARGNQERDADNRYLWRMNRRKLEAELIRDSVLALAGKLDRTLYGPSFEDFVIDKPEHSPHYEYHLHDPEDPQSHRRSVYRFLVRSQPQPFMASLDCADPSMQVDKRNESLSALQALTLLNNPFMATMSQHFARRLETLPGTMLEKVDRAYYEAVGRKPSESERQQLADFAEQHGLANLCRVLVNLNEFVFVD